MPEKKSEFAPVLKITLYLPDGEPQEYFNCTVGASLVPELEFYGTLRETYFMWRRVHITSTTLPYIIEEQLD